MKIVRIAAGLVLITVIGGLLFEALQAFYGDIVSILSIINGAMLASLLIVLLVGPALVLFRYLGWNSQYHFAILGGLSSLGLYHLVYDALPAWAAYRDGRYIISQVIADIIYLDAHVLAAGATLTGVLVGFVFWLIARPDMRSGQQPKIKK